MATTIMNLPPQRSVCLFINEKMYALAAVACEALAGHQFCQRVDVHADQRAGGRRVICDRLGGMSRFSKSYHNNQLRQQQRRCESCSLPLWYQKAADPSS